ncbi:MarR family protein [Streptomyces sp. 2221.1]|nr:MarR family transcriptional regulator [Streptomyces sp. 2221.1]REH20574.1 MarR family protein [Streptomyces sp. 2221.1]
MAHDAFAHHGLGSSALLILGALHARPNQTVSELVITSSVSRATTYRALRRLAHHGLVLHIGEIWSLAPRALEGFGNSHPEAVTDQHIVPAHGWDLVAHLCGTAGTAASRAALHAAERVAYREALERLSEHRSKGLVVFRDGHQVLVPALRADEVPAPWRGPGGLVIDPATGRIDPAWRVASDGRLILITPTDQRSYDELAAAHAEALTEWESVA